ncbi:MAG: DegT/DnrJ/EryC1/StrS family aminotransferase [Desulfarculales bacterium]|nr:DegT/DnrJ/EryC1/StrS family aminotransferase [Desulfarculales bacterium]
MLPFIDLKTQYQRLKPQIDRRIAQVLDHGRFIMGPEVAELETALALYTGAGNVITCSSGTDALQMVLMAWDIGPGDAVFVPAFTFFATAEVVALLGATPVLVDVDPGTFNMNPNELEMAVKAFKYQNECLYPLPVGHEQLTPKAIIIVDLFGQPADYRKLLSIAQAYDLLTLEDAAQSFGAGYKSHKTANLGCLAAITSFFPAKPLGCFGDGGAIFTNHEKLAASLKSIRAHGQGNHKYDHLRLGLTARLDTVQAAILLPKLAVFDEEIAARQEVAAGYEKRLAGSGITTPYARSDILSVWSQYSILTPQRDEVAEALRRNGIPSNIYYPRSLHQQPALRYLGYPEDSFAVSRGLCEKILSLPMHPYLKSEDQDRICRIIIQTIEK